jgi:hypothetical protein
MWNDPDPEDRLALICSGLDTDARCALAFEAARLRCENQALLGETVTADAFDVLSDVLNVERDADMCDWMPRGWSPSYLGCDSESDGSESGE